MAGDLDHVFARESARGAHDGEEHLVNVLALAHHVAEMEGVRRRR